MHSLSTPVPLVLALAVLVGHSYLRTENGTVHAQTPQCIKCNGSRACGPGNQYTAFCCCTVNCVPVGGVPVCACSDWCTHCGECFIYGNCNFQQQTCSLGVPEADRVIGPDKRPPGSRFFRFTDYTSDLLKAESAHKKSPLAYVLLLNLTTGRNRALSGWLGAAADALEPRHISGIADEGAGDFEYEGTVDIQEGHVTLDIISQPDAKRKTIRRTRADVWEEGPVEVTVTYD